jgi:hypothetical protein
MVVIVLLVDVARPVVANSDPSPASRVAPLQFIVNPSRMCPKSALVVTGGIGLLTRPDLDEIDVQVRGCRVTFLTVACSDERSW